MYLPFPSGETFRLSTTLSAVVTQTSFRTWRICKTNLLELSYSDQKQILLYI